MFEILATVFDLLIALVGLFFTIRQVICDFKAKRKEKAEEKCCYELAQKASKIRTLIESIKSSKNVMQKVDFSDPNKLFEAITVAHEGCGEIYHNCKKVKDDIEHIYAHLLKNESMFSLSIGFGRVIDACRPVVYEMDLHLSCLNEAYIALHNTTRRIGFHQGGKMTEGDSTTLEKNFEDMIEKLNTISELLEGVYPMIRELELKFSTDLEPIA